MTALFRPPPPNSLLPSPIGLKFGMLIELDEILCGRYRKPMPRFDPEELWPKNHQNQPFSSGQFLKKGKYPSINS